MYQTLTFLHSQTRWLVLLSLTYAIYRSFKGYQSQRKFTKTDDSVRHWTASIAHIQLIIGMIFYLKSPVIKYFWKNVNEATASFEHLFFGLIHITLMITAIIIITIGSALAKRKLSDKEKFKTIGIWFSIALMIIFIAIPWPFSPFVNRPYFR
ncbi:hypothetical protein F3J23_07200 [Chryseobacterium sp. Tr-659]|uniref:hypothetical protein n=1 Tax=Chryseobacterium sp. Tr-659 TaxID=2608340 RepID=UPI0014248D51|nr:hypothetical protein [Chryseobacterium sp. Tr-659]NIF05228.1 hypothetical protein [Chryseobacterium sp. Tr-659]